jgi:aspartate aminotransferase
MAQGSAIRKMFEEALVMMKQYGADNVFDLSLGNPIMEPPKEFNQEMLRLAQNPTPGMHRYMPNAGYPETLAAVAAQLAKDTGVKFSAGDVVMTCGTAGALNIAFKTLLNPGDEVITFAPYFFEYRFYIDNHGGILKILTSDENFDPDFNVFEKEISRKTRAVIINSPNNPTGKVYSEKVLKQLAELLKNKSAEYGNPIFVISDDVYCRVVFDGIKCPRIINYYPDSIIVTSFSKDLALPGERIGYAAVHPDCGLRQDVAGGLIYSNRVLGYVNAPALLQHLVTNIQNVTIDPMEYQRKRDFLYGNLTKMGYSIVKPGGAFYLFPKTPGKDDLAFVQELKQYRVLVVPGSSFNAPGYFRICYCLSDRTLEGSLEGFRKAAQMFIK